MSDDTQESQGPRKRRPRRGKRTGEVRTARIPLRCTPTEYAEIHANAQAADLTVTEFLIRRGTGVPVRSRTDDALIREIRKIGGLVKVVSLRIGDAHKARTAAMLDELTRLILMISEGVPENFDATQSETP